MTSTSPATKTSTKVEATILKLARRLETSDCVTFVRRQLISQPKAKIVNCQVPALNNRTILHYACWHGRIETVRYLLEAEDASVQVFDNSNASPLLIAAWAGQTPVVELLLETLLDKNIRNIHKILDAEGVPPFGVGKQPQTALVWAQRKGCDETVHCLTQAALTARRQRKARSHRSSDRRCLTPVKQSARQNLTTPGKQSEQRSLTPGKQSRADALRSRRSSLELFIARTSIERKQ